MGVDIETYRGRIGTFRYSSGVDVVTLVCLINLSGGIKVIGSVLFIGLLLLLSGIEPNPGPKENDVEQKKNTIKVSGIPEGIDKQYLSLVFKNVRKSGGGKISHMQFDEDDHSAIIQFEDPATVQSVLQRRPIELSGIVLEVDSFEGEATPNTSMCTSSTIEVSGLLVDDEKMISELLELYFEDEESSGGDTVVDITIVDKEKALVTFESIEVAQRVVNKGSHTLKQKTVIVVPHTTEDAAPTHDINTDSSTESMEYSSAPSTRISKTRRLTQEVDVADILVEVEEPKEPSKVVNKLPVTDDEIRDKAKSNMEKILQMTDLTDKFPGKITIKDIMSIDIEANSKQNFTTEELPWILLRRILGVQSKARDLLAVNDDTDNTEQIDATGDDTNIFDIFPVEETYKESKSICPLDLFVTTIHCCDPMLKQLLFQKLYLCKIAFPFLQFHMSSNDWELVLWPFRSLIVESQTNSQTSIQIETKEFEILELPVKTVTFANFGRPDYSKSKVANDLLSDEIQDIFFNMNCPLGTTSKGISKGLVEMCILPSNGLKDSTFEESVVFFNMRGKIEMDFTTAVTNFISKISDLLVLLVDKSFISTDAEVISTLITRFTAITLILTNPLDSVDVATIKEFNQKLPPGTLLKVISTFKGLSQINPKELSVILKKSIVTQLRTVKVKSLDDRFNECPYPFTDETVPDCTKGKEIATQVFKSMIEIGNKDKWKCLITPIHHISSKHLGASIRNLHRLKDVKETHKVTAKIKELRQDQLKNISIPMKSFIQSLGCENHKPIIVQYLIQWLSILLDRQKRERLPSLFRQNQLCRQKLADLQSKASSNEKDMKSLKEEIDKSQEHIEDTNFGLEHLFREVGHIYESLIVLDIDTATVDLPNVQNIVNVFALLIIAGQPFEIIDGDNFYLPCAWVGKVLEQVSLNIQSRKSLALSVLGVQSTGKSTLLNSLFGTLFPVKSGRCTRGIHMQVMPILPNKNLPYGYVTIIDSEGLRSTERTNIGYTHDNELSTVIAGLGDITLLNVMGENTNEIRDIVQVVVHAFLKLKLANKHLDIGKMFYLVHQNVLDTAAQDNMRIGLNALIETLDTATKNAGEIEGMHQIKAFRQVIDFDINANIWYLPSYWQGNPPMTRVNSAYSDRVFDKRGTLLKRASCCKDKSYKSLVDIAGYIKDLWKGILTEDFVFCFRNSLEIKVYIQMEETLKDILTKFEDNIENELIILSQELFSKCSTHNELLFASDSLIKQMQKVSIENVSHAVLRINLYFEQNDYKEIIFQWEDFAKKRIESLSIELNDRIRTETIKLRERTRVELTIKQNILVHEANLYERSLHVAKCIQGESLNMREIEQKFEEIWEQISSEILNPSKVEDVSKSLASSFERCLFDMFNTETLILKSELEKRRLSNPQVHVEVEGGASMNFLMTKTLKGSFEVSEIVIDDISFSSEWCSDINELKLARIKGEIDKTFDKIESEVDVFLKERDDLTYREVRKILNKINKEIQILCNKENGFSLKITGVIKLLIHVSGFCVAKFDEHNDEYQRSKGILARVTNYKIQVREQFVAYVQDRKQEEAAAKQISLILENILWDKMEERIQVTVKIALKQHFPQLKFHLILEVLEYLTNEDDFESFIQYIKHPRKRVKQWVKNEAKNYLFSPEKRILSEMIIKIVNEYYDDIKESIEKSCDDFSSDNPSTENWIELFVKNFSKCPIGAVNFQNVTKWFGQIEDIKNFSRLLREHITDSSDRIKLMAQRNEETMIKFSGPTSSVKTLFEQAWGCPEQCPFCGEPCAKGFIHNGTNHFSLQHRVSCCFGVREDFIHKPVLSSCNFNVQSDLDHHCDMFGFRCNKGHKKPCNMKWHPFKNYKDHVPDWDIEPNADIQECSKFWLWFVAKYKYHLAVHYRYDVSDIPDSWDEITKEEALANLRRTYSL